MFRRADSIFSQRAPAWACVLSLVLLLGLGGRAGAEAEAPGDIAFTAQDRILVLAPHPDDEVLGCGGVIQRAVALNLPVRVVFLTYGDYNEWSFLVYRKRPVLRSSAVQQMGLMRHDEAIRAAERLGLKPAQLVFLGYPDQGLMSLWTSHWGEAPPYRSRLTRTAAVPYRNARRPGAAYKGEELLKDLTAELASFRPTQVFVPHPADYHPDHRAGYLFTRVALWDLASQFRPQLHPYLIHFRDWPQPLGYQPERALEPPAAFAHQIAWQRLPLRRAEVECKFDALKAHASQYEASPTLLTALVRAQELFGDFETVQLHPDHLPNRTLAGVARMATDSPEELAGVERSSLIGMEWRFVQLDDADLVFSITLSRPLAKAVELAVPIYGYRPDRPFSRQPKLHIKLDEFSSTISDQDQPLPDLPVAVTRSFKTITVRIPLALLGHPRHVLLGARLYFGDLPVDWMSWRVLEIPSSPP